jgi:GDPmannose 4,6-dehydratase
MISKTAVITGITGQDGFYLAHYLLDLGYRVVGIDRRTSLPTDYRLRTLRGSPNLLVITGDVTDLSSLEHVVSTYQPDEFYHLAAQSHVGESWKAPIATVDITGIGTLNCLEAIRKQKPDCKFYFAGSSEQFGNTIQIPELGTRFPRRFPNAVLNENSPMHPESPYAAAKVFGYNITHVYRRSYDMFASCGILFNHESPVRGDQFVTRKITLGLANILAGHQEELCLGNLSACRDWGFAGDYVKAMHGMLQLDHPDDFVVATGETHSVQEFVDIACDYLNANKGTIKVDPDLLRPKDVDVLIGDSTKAKNILNWEATTSFEELVHMMCDHDKAFVEGRLDIADTFLGVKNG